MIQRLRQLRIALPLTAALAAGPALADAPDEDAKDPLEAAVAPEAAVIVDGDEFYDLWDTGTGTRKDDEGRLVYTVKTELRPRSRAQMRNDSAWDPFYDDRYGYYVPGSRTIRRAPVNVDGSRTRSTSSAGTTSRPSSRATPRSAPSSSPRRSHSGGSRPNKR